MQSSFGDPGFIPITPLALAVTLAGGVLVLTLPRRWAPVPVMAMASLMTLAQTVTLGPLHFTALRLLLLWGFARIILRGELRQITLNPIDKVLLWWLVFQTINYTILWGTSDALINQLGRTYDVLGVYFLFRCTIRDFDDVTSLFKSLSLLLVPVAVFMVTEKVTGRNLLSFLGGVPEYTVVREGVRRAQGPFRAAMLAGTYGASSIPLLITLFWSRPKYYFLAFIGIVSGTAITIAAGSSGPILTYAAGISGLLMWRFRRNMRAVRWGVVFGLLVVQMFMSVPVWFLLAKLNVFSASTGYYRAFLVDRWIANFFDWWLIGTQYRGQWAAAEVMLYDVANWFVRVSIDGGLIALILFTAVIVHCFRGVGVRVRALRGTDPDGQRRLWAMGAALFAHVVTFFSIWYFDQIAVFWYMLLACISSTTGFLLRKPVRSAVSIGPVRDEGLRSADILAGNNV